MEDHKRILVVDDEANIRELLFDVLSGKGFNVTLAKDGIESLNHMSGRRFDLLITDIDMPGLDGLKLLKMMKKNGRREKVIVMTGRSARGLKLGCDMQPVFRMLEKPFNIEKFLTAVSSALRDKAARAH